MFLVGRTVLALSKRKLLKFNNYKSRIGGQEGKIEFYQKNRRESFIMDAFS
jgi:hypothetical protein